MTQRRRRLIGALVVVVVVVLFVAAAALAAGFWVRSESEGLGRVSALLDDGDRHSTAFEAGDTLAEVAGLLLTEARRCDVSRETRRRCEATAQAAAFAQALAVRVLECTAPGRFEVRRALRDHLAAIDAMAPNDPPPPPPQLPTC